MSNNVIIFGDSYSTFESYIPKGNAAYYSKNCATGTDVTDVSQTWWHQVVKEANLNLLLNDSWSGSTIGYTGYENSDCSHSSSFIYRLRKLAENGFLKENEINTVFIFGGTNDSWSNAPLGIMKFDDFEEKELYFVLPAICYFFKLIKELLPKADIYCLINTDLKPEISECMKKACEIYGITKITFERIDKQSGHPSIQGMNDIKNVVLHTLNTLP